MKVEKKDRMKKAAVLVPGTSVPRLDVADSQESGNATGVTGKVNAKMLKTSGNSKVGSERTWFGRLHRELQEACDIPRLVAAVSQGVKGSGYSGFEHKKGPGGKYPRGGEA